MSYSPPKPTVSPFIRVLMYFSEITILPLYVVCSGEPEEIGMVLIAWLLLYTVMGVLGRVHDADLTAPEVKCTCLCCCP